MTTNYLKLAINDPAIIGPGYWVNWHRKSLVADNRNKKIEVARSIAVDIARFPCNHCREHALYYVGKHPMKDAIDDDHIFSMFYWTVDFHNAVNSFLGKIHIPREEAIAMWDDTNVCKEGDCTNNKQEKLEDKKRFERTVNKKRG